MKINHASRVEFIKNLVFDMKNVDYFSCNNANDNNLFFGSNIDRGVVYFKLNLQIKSSHHLKQCFLKYFS